MYHTIDRNQAHKFPPTLVSKTLTHLEFSQESVVEMGMVVLLRYANCLFNTRFWC